MSKIDKRLTFPLLSTLISLLNFRSPTSEFHSDIMCCCSRSAKLDKQQRAEGNGGRGQQTERKCGRGRGRQTSDRVSPMPNPVGGYYEYPKWLYGRLSSVMPTNKVPNLRSYSPDIELVSLGSTNCIVKGIYC